jgi:hypothetical protein
MEEIPEPRERIIIPVNAEESEDEDEYEDDDEFDDDDDVDDSLRAEVEYGGDIVVPDCTIDLQGPQFERENALEGEMRNVPAKRGRKSGAQSKVCKKLFRSGN